MLRAAFTFIFLTLYILILGPPLLIYTVLTKNPNPLYWAALKGVLFFVRAAGVRIKVKGIERIPPGTVIFAANHTSAADPPAVVGAIPRRIAILLKRSLFGYPIVGQAFHLAQFIPVDRFDRESAITSLEKATEATQGRTKFFNLSRGNAQPGRPLAGIQEGNCGDGHQSRSAAGADRLLQRAPHHEEARPEDLSGRNPGRISSRQSTPPNTPSTSAKS